MKRAQRGECIIIIIIIISGYKEETYLRVNWSMVELGIR